MKKGKLFLIITFFVLTVNMIKSQESIRNYIFGKEDTLRAKKLKLELYYYQKEEITL